MDPYAIVAATRAMCQVMYGDSFDLHDHGSQDPEGRASLERSAEAAIEAYLERVEPRPSTDLAASERAMQMICSTIHNGKQKSEQMWDVERIVNAWVFHPDRLTPDAMKEDLPHVRLGDT